MADSRPWTADSWVRDFIKVLTFYEKKMPHIVFLTRAATLQLIEVGPEFWPPSVSTKNMVKVLNAAAAAIHGKRGPASVWIVGPLPNTLGPAPRFHHNPEQLRSFDGLLQEEVLEMLRGLSVQQPSLKVSTCPFWPVAVPAQLFASTLNAVAGRVVVRVVTSKAVRLCDEVVAAMEQASFLDVASYMSSPDVDGSSSGGTQSSHSDGGNENAEDMPQRECFICFEDDDAVGPLLPSCSTCRAHAHEQCWSRMRAHRDYSRRNGCAVCRTNNSIPQELLQRERLALAEERRLQVRDHLVSLARRGRYRTSLCTYFARGFCCAGDWCAFAHGPHQLRPFGLPSSEPDLS